MSDPNGEETIFAQAIQLPPEERAAFLDRCTHSDAPLRERIESLIRAYEAGEYLEEAANPLSLAAGPIAAVPGAEKVGDRIGNYKLLQKIGEGGCGIVYMADQEQPVRRRVALKIIKLGMDTKSVIARFEAERQALALMDHPSIAKVFDAGATETGRPYFVMELVRGRKLTDYCDEAKLSIRARLDLFVQVCHAVQHAHQKGIIHRDLKPSNILVTVNDGVAVPKVIDFGIAKATGGQQLTDKTLFTAFEQFIGTPAYMSPEQAVLTSVDIDTRSDIYALGVLLYEVLTGKTPFDSQELLAIGLDEMRRTIREKEPDRPSTRLSTLADNELSTAAQRRDLKPPELMSELRGDLDWIVMKCLEKDRGRRYETASGLAADIQRHLTNEPVTACPPGKLYKFQKLLRRNKLAFAAAGAVLVSLLAGLTVSAVLFFKERAARGRADQQAAVAQAISDFLQFDLLSQAQTTKQTEEGFKMDPNLTVRQAVDRASARLESRFTNQPLVEASIRSTLAEIYDEMGDPEAHRTNAQRAFELRQRILGPTDRLTVTAMDQMRDADPVKNVGWKERTLTLAQRVLGSNDSLTLRCMDNLAQAYESAQMPEKALGLMEDSVRLHQAKFGPDSGDTLWAKHDLAVAYMHAGRASNAVPLLEKNYRLLKETPRLGPGHLLTVSDMDVLASAYEAVGRRDEALHLLEEELTLLQKNQGPADPATIWTMLHLGTAYSEAGRLTNSIQLREQALTLCEAKLGLDHRTTLFALNDLATIYQETGRVDDALRLFEKELALCQKNLGPEDPSTLTAMHNVAGAYRELGQLTNSIQLFEKELKLCQSKLGLDHRTTLAAMNGLAASYVSAGRVDDALPLQEQCVKLGKDKLGVADPDTRNMAENLAETCKMKGRFAEAQQALDVVLTGAFMSQPESASLLWDRANLAAQQKLWSGAIADLSRVIDLTPGDVVAWHSLAALLVQAGDLEHYRAHCQRSLKQFGDTTDRTTAERIAKDCLILPSSGADPHALAKLANLAASGPADEALLPWYQFCKGLHDYRLGNLESAAEWLQASLSRPGDRLDRDMGGQAVLAMVNWGLKRTDPARSALAKAISIADTELPKIQNAKIGVWLNWIISNALLREARALIEDAPSAKPQPQASSR